MEKLLFAPFLGRYWPILLTCCVTVLLCYVIQFMLQENKKKNEPKERNVTFDKNDLEDVGLWERETDDGESLIATSGEEEEVTHIPFKPYVLPISEMIQRSKDFYELMNKRRTLRFFSSKAVPFEVIENVIRSAGIVSVCFCQARKVSIT